MLFIMTVFRQCFCSVYGAFTVQDQVVGVKGVDALRAAVSWRRKMKASVDTFVPTHIKGPFEGRTLCDDGF